MRVAIVLTEYILSTQEGILNMADEIFSAQRTHQKLIRALYQDGKSKNRKFSLSFLCRRAGIPSKGYLGDVMKAKRKLNLKYALKLGQAFGLSGSHLKFFILIVSRDQEHDPVVREKIERALASTEKRLHIRRVPLKSTLNLRLISRIFGLCGVIKPPITVRKLHAALPELSESAIDKALGQLVLVGALTEENAEFQITGAQFMFPTGNEPRVVNDFFRDSLSEALSVVPKWLTRPKESFFQSTVLSVKKAVYQEKLEEIREFFDGIQSDIESNDADSVVYFNIQIYPQK